VPFTFPNGGVLFFQSVHMPGSLYEVYPLSFSRGEVPERCLGRPRLCPNVASFPATLIADTLVPVYSGSVPPEFSIIAVMTHPSQTPRISFLFSDGIVLGKCRVPYEPFPTAPFEGA